MIPRAWSCTQPTIRVLWAGPHTGQGPQAAARQRGGHGAPPHRRRRDGGGDPSQLAGDTSLSVLPTTSTHLNFPTCKPPPQVLEHCVNDSIFQTNFLSPITLLLICEALSKLLDSCCFDKDGSFLFSRARVCSELWWRWWCRCDGWYWGMLFDVGISLLVSSVSASIKYSYLMLGLGWV